MSDDKTDGDDGVASKSPAGDFLLEEYRTLRLELLARLELQQQNVTAAYVAAGATVALISGIISNLGFSKFLSHEAAVLLPSLAVVLVVISFRQLAHREQMRVISEHLNKTTLPAIKQAFDRPLEPFGENSPEVGTRFAGRHFWRIFGNEVLAPLSSACVVTGLSFGVTFSTHTYAASWNGLYGFFLWIGLFGEVVASVLLGSVQGKAIWRRIRGRIRDRSRHRRLPEDGPSKG